MILIILPATEIGDHEGSVWHIEGPNRKGAKSDFDLEDLAGKFCEEIVGFSVQYLLSLRRK